MTRAARRRWRRGANLAVAAVILLVGVPVLAVVLTAQGALALALAVFGLPAQVLRALRRREGAR